MMKGSLGFFSLFYAGGIYKFPVETSPRSRARQSVSFLYTGKSRDT